MQTINLGSGIGTGTGEPTRSALEKCNNNFSELNEVKQNKIEGDLDITGTAPAIIINGITNDTIAYWELTADSTFTLAINNGRALTLFLTKGVHVFTPPANINWLTPVPTLGDTGYNIFEFFASRGNIYGSYLGNVVPVAP